MSDPVSAINANAPNLSESLSQAISQPNITKKIISLGKYHAAYWEMGHGTPLIFLHGFLGQSLTWQPLLPLLAPHFHCIALDLLGFGESSQPRLKYVIDHQVEFVTEFLAALAAQGLNLENFGLVGYSYGGWTAAALNIAQAIDPFSKPPSKIHCHQLALVAPAGIRDDQFVGRYDYLRPLLWESPLVDWTLAASKPVAKLLGRARKWQEIYRARQELQRQPVAKSFLCDRLRPEDAIDTVETKIHQINIPTVVVAGGQDTTIPLWHCETYGTKIPQARLHVLANADHDLIQTHTAELAAYLRQHFR
ncbi:MAG: alpha/beta fold hydrolase [Pseudanabaenaceae cyanobacterium]